jgi:hypothetical protein
MASRSDADAPGRTAQQIQIGGEDFRPLFLDDNRDGSAGSRQVAVKCQPAGTTHRPPGRSSQRARATYRISSVQFIKNWWTLRRRRRAPLPPHREPIRHRPPGAVASGRQSAHVRVPSAQHQKKRRKQRAEKRCGKYEYHAGLRARAKVRPRRQAWRRHPPSQFISNIVQVAARTTAPVRSAAGTALKPGPNKPTANGAAIAMHPVNQFGMRSSATS